MKSFLYILPLVLVASVGYGKESSLFQHRYFTLQTDSNVLCGDSDTGNLTEEFLERVIKFYETQNPGIGTRAVSFLTTHQNPAHQIKVKDFEARCSTVDEPHRCVFYKYWGNKQTARLVLALFYDTKVVLQRTNDKKYLAFSLDQIQLFAKSIRRIPVELRQKMANAKLYEWQTPWEDGTIPMSLTPMERGAFGAKALGEVSRGSNIVGLHYRSLDAGKEGNKYSDLGLEFLVDFRFQLVLHEMAHVVDDYFFWDGTGSLGMFKDFPELSYSEKGKSVLVEDLAIWPSGWWYAFDHLSEVSEGRYVGNLDEKFAEAFAQYILIPTLLKKVAPETYQWLHDTVFSGVTYEGYDSCTEKIVRPLTSFENLISPNLRDFLE